MSLNIDYIRELNSYKSLFENIRSGINTAVFGLPKNEKPFLLHAFDGFLFYIASDFVEAHEMLSTLNSNGGDFFFLPAKEDVLYNKKVVSSASYIQRNVALYRLVNRIGSGIVTTIDAVLQKFPYKKNFADKITKIKKGNTVDIMDLTKLLTEMGYKNNEDLPYAGTFARRGDILDVFCVGQENPSRLEFFGDVVEDIRNFEIETKKSIEHIKSIVIIPAGSIFSNDFIPDELIAKIKRSRQQQKLSTDAGIRLDVICSEVFSEIEAGFLENTWTIPFIKHSVITDYFDKDIIVLWDEPKKIADKAERVFEEHYKRMAYLIEKGELLPEGKDQLIDHSVLPYLFNESKQISFQSIAAANNLFSPKRIETVRSSPIVSYKQDLSLLASDIKNWIINGYKVVAFAGDMDDCERINKELGQYNQSLSITTEGLLSRDNAVISTGNYKRGFINHIDKLVIIGTEDLFVKFKPKAKIKKVASQVFVAPEIGDYVVHETHGVGLCEGVVSLPGSFGVKDFILVRYRDEDKLYVPVEAANLLSRYSGSDTKPHLNKLGGNEFEKVKLRVKNKIKEMAIDLVKLYSARENVRGFVYCGDKYLEQRFGDAFPYTETGDQLACIEDINNDLASEKIMDRLICGDVGYGKTEVALRAAFKVILSGKQVAFMSPTTILAEQHFQTVQKRFAEFDLDIKCLNRFRSRKEQKEIIESIKEGKTSFVCGTHRLLSKDVVFNDLGLLILDEEQRFGVEAKETIKEIKKNVDVLVLSATPIPRTLHMALSGMRDISVIQTAPKERIPVEISVIENNESLLRDIILREFGRNGQVFIVYNRVETIDSFTANLINLVPEVKFVIGHGQMDEKILEDNIFKFAQGEADVLVSSTIIENGIDIPNANTLIVYDADNFGLSQLYQLRGRVGRSDRLAYAYFMYKENKILSKTAYKRLSSISEYTELGSGFKIAIRDLEIRGAGNVLGREQHGHMEKVGYDLYCKLLAESMNEIRGLPKTEKLSVSIDVALDASASGYIEDSESRMSFYQRLSDANEISKIDDLFNEVIDIFGNPPVEVTNLFEIIRLKILAGKAGLAEVIIKNGYASICFAGDDDLKREKVFQALSIDSKHIKLDISSKLKMEFDYPKLGVQEMFGKVNSFVLEIQK